MKPSTPPHPAASARTRAASGSLRWRLPVSLGAVLRYIEADKLDIAVAVWVALGLIGGAFAGARIALALPSKTVRRIYGLFLFAVAARFLLFG